MTTLQEAFDADLTRLNAAITASGAVIADDEGQWIDPEKVPTGLLDTYSRLLQYGYANGLLP